VLLGLSFWAGVASIVIGVLVGSCILAPMSLFGMRNGTNDPVSRARTSAFTAGSSARFSRC
jgi:purine-cytosine permease-like protein